MSQWKITFSKSLCLVTSFYLILGFSQTAWAGCGILETSCLVVQGGEEFQQPCKIKICANANEFVSNWQLDNGFTVVDKQSSDLNQVMVNGHKGKEGYTCYASEQANTVICAEDVSL